VEHLLTGHVRGDLDRLLMHDAGLGMTRLAWLTRPAVEATAKAVKTSIEKLLHLRKMNAHTLDLSMLPAERRRFLATVGRRSTGQALERRDLDRRYPMLALVAQSAVDQLDEVIALFDQAVSARESRARSRTDEALVERAKKGEARATADGCDHPGGAGGGRLHRRPGHRGVDGGGGDFESAECLRCPEDPRGCADLVRPGPVRRVLGQGTQGR
jgi:hypothetical protein